MFRNLSFIFFFFLHFILFSQVSDFLSIPSHISDKANAVIINKKVYIELISQSRLKLDYKSKIIIFNKQADDLANIVIPFDNNTRVTSLRLNFYNLNGKLIQKVSKSDFLNVAASGHATLYSDNRALIYHHTPTVYPYIMTLEYSMKSDDTAFIPPWYAYPDYNVGVMRNEYHVTYPEGFKLYKIEKNLDSFHVIKSQYIHSAIYIATELPSLIREPYSPSFSDLSPYVRLAFNKFQLAGVKATVNNWDDYGVWMQEKLLKGRNDLSLETKNKVLEMVKGVSNSIEKAKIIYDYVQQKTRYINVAIGIGGWQPMYASQVDKLGYGDCKALTYYTKSLLEVAGVSAIYTIVNAGNKPKDIDENFIGLQGNHAFLCLPQKNDTIWLECTNQKLPFGFVNSFTDNRKVWAIIPGGSKLVHTKALKPSDNYQKIIAHYQIKNNGGIKADLSINSYGDIYTKHLSYFDGLAPEKLAKRFSIFFNDLQNINYDSIQVYNNKDKMRFEEKISLSASNYVMQLADSSLLFRPNAFNKNTNVPPRIQEKKFPLILKRGYKEEDIYTIQLPKGYMIDQLPEEVSIVNEFGSYKLSFKKIAPNKIKYHRVFLLNGGKFPNSTYQKYRKFRKKIRKLENQKLLLLKK